MARGSYTELFFLDEATALAAGHRPCGTCRKAAFNSFVSVWRLLDARAGAGVAGLDDTLHSQRAAVIGKAALPTADLGSIPDGCMIALEQGGDPHVVFQGCLYRWSFDGYDSARDIPKDTQVILITPSATKEIIAGGYHPEIHSSASGKPGVRSTSSSGKQAPRAQVASNPSEPKLNVPIASSKLTSAPVASAAARLYKLDVTPRGKDLYAYFAAVLQVTGMDRGESFPLKKFIGNFSGHESASRILRAGSSNYRLSESGLEYFRDRLEPGNPQFIAQAEVDRFKQCILRGGGKGWSLINHMMLIR
jgi:hypothetical protein